MRAPSSRKPAYPWTAFFMTVTCTDTGKRAAALKIQPALAARADR
jgi:hypothetical protein